MNMDTDLLKILIERTSYINTYWNFYIAVATTIVGLLASGKIQITRTLRIIITIAFIAFAYVNYDSISDINKQRNAIIEKITDENLKKIKNTFKPKGAFGYFFFHFVLDMTVMVAIWKFSPKNE